MSHAADLNEKYQWLLKQAKYGQLSVQEIAEVAAELQKERPETLRYSLLHILGKAGDTSYRSLVEQFLECREDPMLSKMALRTLCDYWHFTDEYRDTLLRFVRGVSWDDEQHVRRVAIQIAGEYLIDHSDTEMLRELLSIYEDSQEDKSMRDWTYQALSRAMGRDFRQILITNKRDPAVLIEAKNRLAQESE